MNVPPWAGFVADFPDDQVESGENIQVYGGRNVAVALGQIFAGLGCSRVSAPKPAGDQGWEFGFQYGDRNRFGCRVQSFYPVFWLLFEEESASDGTAHVELWRKFGNALERDPRFHKILWRSFKEGPPDWDEVEAASDPPDLIFDERFPSSKVKAKASRARVWPYVIGVLLTLSGVVTPFAPEHPDLFHRIGYAVCGVFLFLLGVFFFLIAIGQGRESLLTSSLSAERPKTNASDQDELRLGEQICSASAFGGAPSSIRRRKSKATGRRFAPALVIAWFVLEIGAVTLIGKTIHGANERSEWETLATAVLLVGLAVAVGLVGRWRRGSPGPD